MLGAFFFLLSIFLFFSNYRYISIILVFVLLTSGFQMIPVKYLVMPSVGVNKSYDWVLLIQGALLLLRPQVFLDLRVWKKFKEVIIYGILLLVLLFYSLFIKNVEASVCIRVFRSLIYFTTLFLFVQLDLEELKKVFCVIIYITCFTALIYCFQPFVHKTLLNRVSTDFMGDSQMIERYYNLPVYIYPVIFFLFFSEKIFPIKFRYLFLLFCSATILLSQHRILLFAIIICYFLHFLLTHHFSVSKILLYSFICVGLLFVADSIWNKRFSKGLDDLSQMTLVVSPSAYYDVNLSELTTSEFRKLLLQERLDYILKNKNETFLGTGLITDDSRKGEALDFSIGMSDGYGSVTQVSSGDIAWSSLILQLGLGGVFVFIFFHLALLRKFLSCRYDSYMHVGALFICCLFINSFYSNTIVLPFITALLMLFGAYYYHLTNSDLEKKYNV